MHYMHLINHYEVMEHQKCLCLGIHPIQDILDYVPKFKEKE